MGENILKGFCPQEIVDLYRYLCIYEKELKYIQNQECLWEQHPDLKELEDLILALNCNYSTQKYLKNCFFVPVNDWVSMTKCRSSKIQSFLHHLRNSIAHGQIEQEEGYVHLFDYAYEEDRVSGEKIKIFSMMGRIKSSVLFELIHIVNKNISL